MCDCAMDLATLIHLTHKHYDEYPIFDPICDNFLSLPDTNRTNLSNYYLASSWIYQVIRMNVLDDEKGTTS